MDNFYKTYAISGVKQANKLTEELKSLDSIHSQGISPISVFGEMPTNLFHSHNLVKLFESKFKQKITVIRLPHRSFIKASIKSYETEHKIYVTQHNPCWTRFYICKELSQILIYEASNSTHTNQDIEILFSHLINGVHNDKKPQISADWVTYFIAIEFLLPSAIVAELLKLKTKGFNNNLIAKKMLVPEKIVDFRLSDEGCEIFDNL